MRARRETGENEVKGESLEEGTKEDRKKAKGYPRPNKAELLAFLTYKGVPPRPAHQPNLLFHRELSNTGQLDTFITSNAKLQYSMTRYKQLPQTEKDKYIKKLKESVEEYNTLIGPWYQCQDQLTQLAYRLYLPQGTSTLAIQKFPVFTQNPTKRKVSREVFTSEEERERWEEVETEQKEEEEEAEVEEKETEEEMEAKTEEVEVEAEEEAETDEAEEETVAMTEEVEVEAEEKEAETEGETEQEEEEEAEVEEKEMEAETEEETKAETEEETEAETEEVEVEAEEEEAETEKVEVEAEEMEAETAETEDKEEVVVVQEEEEKEEWMGEKVEKEEYEIVQEEEEKGEEKGKGKKVEEGRGEEKRNKKKKGKEEKGKGKGKRQGSRGKTKIGAMKGPKQTQETWNQALGEAGASFPQKVLPPTPWQNHSDESEEDAALNLGQNDPGRRPTKAARYSYQELMPESCTSESDGEAEFVTKKGCPTMPHHTPAQPLPNLEPDTESDCDDDDDDEEGILPVCPCM